MTARLLLACTLLAAPLLATPAVSNDEPHFSEENLTLDLSELGEVTVNPGAGTGQLRGFWSAKMDGRKLDLSMLFLPRSEFGLNHPNETLDLIESHKQRSQNSQKEGIFTFETKDWMHGEFGVMPFAGFATHTQLQGTKPVKTVMIFTGVLADSAYALEIHAEPALLDEHREQLKEILSEGLAFSGEVVDPDWTDEEARTRWKEMAPDELSEDPRDLYIVRTKHYIILTNQKGNTAKKFGQVMEECYEKIRTIFPFEDIEGQRLLPLLLFRDPDQYYGLLVKRGWTIERARKTGGVAFGDCYATFFKAKNDPVHIHEATHQIFRNRLFLGGGGSWYQEGAAEYVCNEPNETTTVRNIVKKERGLKLREMVGMQSLLFSSDQNRVDGGSAGGEAYKQAGILIEYLRQSEKHREGFLDFIHAVGSVGRNDVPAIERAIHETLSVSLEELDAELVEYCDSRPKKMDRFKPIKFKKRR